MDFFTVYYLRTANGTFTTVCGWAAKCNSMWLHCSDNCTVIRWNPVQKEERKLALALEVTERSALQAPGSSG